MSLLELIIFLVVVIINSIFALLVLINNPRSKSNLFFFFSVLSVILWMTANFFSDYFKNYLLVLWLARGTFIIGVFIPIFIFLFSWYFPKPTRKLNLAVKIILILLSIILPIVSASPFLLKSVQITDQGISEANFGFALYPILLFMISFLVIIFVILAGKMKALAGLAKLQLKYVFLGWFAFLILILLSNLLLPLLTGNVLWSQLGPLFSIIMIGTFTYAIIQYRLLNIRFVLQQSFLYIISFSSFILLYFGLFYFLDTFFRKISFIAPALSGSIASLIFVISFDQLKQIYLKLTNRFVTERSYNYAKTLRTISETIAKSLNLSVLINSVLQVLMQTFRIDKALFFLPTSAGRYTLYKIISDAKNPWNGPQKIILEPDNPLLKYFEKNRTSIISDELEKKTEGSNDLEVKLSKDANKFLQEIGVAVCFPIISKRNLRGILCLGRKLSKDIFYEQDLNLLATALNQIAFAIENAKLFQKVEKQKQELERTLNVTVDREIDMIQLKKENNDLNHKINNHDS